MLDSFDRLTDEALQAYRFAEEEGRRFGYTKLRPEHILLGLLRLEGSLAARVLASYGVTLEKIQKKTERRAFSSERVFEGEIPPTVGVNQILEVADRESECFGEDIGPGHLLLGFLFVDLGTGPSILKEYGIEWAHMRDDIETQLLIVEIEGRFTPSVSNR